MVAACRQFALYGSTALTLAGYFFPKGRHGERSRTMRPLSILQHLCTRPSPLLQGKVRGVPQPNSPWIEMVLVIVCLVGLAHMLDDLFLEADRTEEFLAIGAAHSRMLQLKAPPEFEQAMATGIVRCRGRRYRAADGAATVLFTLCVCAHAGAVECHSNPQLAQPYGSIEPLIHKFVHRQSGFFFKPGPGTNPAA